MTQVSKRYLSPEVKDRIFEILIKAVSKASAKDDVVSFLTDLLSPVERTMLAKRLAIAYLLLKGGHTYREISEMLKVSLGTIERVVLTLNIQGAGYKKITAAMMRDEKIEEFIERIGEALPELPLPKGQDWKRVTREREEAKRKYRQKRTKAF